MKRENRRYPRLEVDHQAILEYGDARFPCRVLNFSIGGLFLSCGEMDAITRISQGELEQSRESKAVVTLEGQPYSIDVGMAHLGKSGLGVFFRQPAKAFFNYLKEYRERKGKGQGGVRAGSGTPLKGGALSNLIDTLNQKTVDYLARQMARFPIIAREDLISESDEINDIGGQSALYAAATVLERDGEQIGRGFCAAVRGAIKDLQKEKVGGLDAGKEASKASSGAELELVDKDDFDEWIKLNDLANKYEVGMGETVHGFHLALSTLLRRPVVGESSPFSPLSLLLQFETAIDAFELSPQAKMILIRAFARVVFSDMRPLFQSLLDWLREQGLAPATEVETYTGGRGAGSVQPPHPVQNQRAEVSAQQERSSLESLAALLDAAGAGRSVRSPANTESSQSYLSTEQVLASLDALTHRDGKSLSAQLGGYLIRTGSSADVDRITQKAIDASEQLLDAVRKDELLNKDVRQLLERFEVPFIKETVKDPALLENDQHPARCFLEAVENLLPYLDIGKQVVPGKSLKSRDLEGIMSGIADVNDMDIVEATAQLENLKVQRRENFEHNRNIAIESCQRNERLRQAHLRVRSSLQQRFLGKKVSIVFEKLFKHGWVNLLIHAAIVSKEESAQWKAYQRVLDILHKLFDCGKPFNPIPAKSAIDLLNVLRKGFRDFPIYPESSKRFIQELHQALTKGGDQARQFKEQCIEIDEAYLKQFFPHRVLANLEPVEIAESDSKWLNLVQDLAIDDWLIETTEGNRERLVNLAWRCRQSPVCLLVDGSGIKVLETDESRLALLFKENRFRLPQDRQLHIVGRAMQRVIENGYDNVQHRVSLDELTGLMNRRAFERMLNELLQEATPGSQIHSLILLDVDKFGLVNDMCGFECGDRLLQSITDILKNNLPESAQLARTGDDEFAVLIPDCGIDQAYQLAEVQRQAIDTFEYGWGDQRVPVSTSLGMVEIASREQTPAELLKAVAAACGIAKQSGRNCTRIYRDTDEAIVNHKRLVKSAAMIEDALHTNRIVLFAQPIVPLLDQEASSHYEILMRVRDEKGELRSPAHFILAAEEFDLMRAVDRWVVQEFFTKLKAHPESLQDIDGFSINLSSQSMADKAFKEYLLQQIENSSIPRQKLGFEITETAMVKDANAITCFINEVRERGCNFYLDDFGSGYASFSYLKDLPVDYVKIDGIFIRDIMEDHASYTMVKSVTDISHFMGKKVIAEFVENQEIADLLEEIGVDYIQGYHIGRPLPLVDALVESLESRIQSEAV
jgi:diguanylate cyclase (GGDEF)-like protein